jgi:hypothetical protein
MSPLHDRHSRSVSSAVFRWLRPIYRYSFTLDAYVLRGIGRRFGPILKRREVSR